MIVPCVHRIVGLEGYDSKACDLICQIIVTFQDSMMSGCLTRSEITSGGVDATVCTFGTSIGRELDEPKQPVNCVSLFNDGNCIFASLDSTLRLIDSLSR